MKVYKKDNKKTVDIILTGCTLAQTGLDLTAEAVRAVICTLPPFCVVRQCHKYSE
jgi:hypothetical protein